MKITATRQGSRDMSNPSSTTLLLDLDGTLVDTAPDLTAALNHVLASHSLKPVRVDQIRDVVGVGAVACLKKGFLINGYPFDEASLADGRSQFIDYYTANICRESQLYANVEQVLKHLKGAGHNLGVCTNKPEALAIALLTSIGIAPLFDTICGSDTVANRKPHPDHILTALERACGEVGACVMVGDTRADVEAAKAAGIPVIVMAYGYSDIPAQDLGSDLVLDAFSALPDALAKIIR